MTKIAKTERHQSGDYRRAPLELRHRCYTKVEMFMWIRTNGNWF